MAASSLVAALALLLVLVAAVGYSEAYGEPSSARPSYQERTFASLINAARVGTQNPLLLSFITIFFFFSCIVSHSPT